ncbi:MAG: AAA family ATPase [Phycisphaerae bacterium]|nr:AAA family ATPase [Phycisphaerae bacterium]
MIGLAGYETHQQLHAGPRSAVYRGRRIEDGLPVVIKVPARQPPDESDLARIRRDFEIGSALSDPRVIRYHDLIRFRDSLALIEEDFPGVPLADRRPDDGMPPEEFLPVAIAVADAVDAMHRKDVIHKDLTPRNILVDPDNDVVKLIDFGIASRLRQETPSAKSPRRIDGTLAYVSPEQTGRMNRALDYRTDFYSMGVTFYELLCGRCPFEVEDPMELVHCHIAKTPAWPHEVNPEIPEAVSRIVMRLLAKDMEARYQSGSGLKADLQRCLDGLAARGRIETFPLGERDRSERFRIPQTLYGRDRQIKQLLDAFDRAAGGESQMLLVSGHAGVGKSVLVNEIQKPITSRRGHFIAGKFGQLSRDVAYSAIAEAFQNLVRQLLGEPDERLRRWRESLLDALGPNGRIVIDLIPELELVIGPQPSMPDVGLVESRNRFNLVFRRFVRAIARSEHPLVLFLDDLQWADSPSLNLIALLMTDPEIRHLLLVGAFRDNEVGPSHPAIALIDVIKREGGTIRSMHLTPLDETSVVRWVADALGCAAEAAQPLAHLLCQKTEGNPFFVKAFLQSLHDEGLLIFDSGTGWRWDMDEVHRLGVTDDVADLLTSRMRGLPDASRELLKTAACLGHTFSIDRLAMVAPGSPDALLSDLRPVLNAGLILRSDSRFSFAHDRVQEAAYALIPDDHRARVHLGVGRLFLSKTPEAQRDDFLFEIVDHLNLGRALMDAEERTGLARLNLAAGKKAKASTAYEPAVRYLAAGAELLGDGGWRQQHRLALELHKDRAEAEFLMGRFEAASRTLDLALTHCESDLDRGELYITRVTQKGIEGQYAGAVSLGIEALRSFGLELPGLDDQDGVDAAFNGEMAWFEQRWGARPISELSDLPVSNARPDLIVTTILSALSDCAMIGAPRYWKLLTISAVNYFIRRGNTQVSPFAYVSHAIVLSSLHEYEAAYQFGEMALRLNEERIRNVGIAGKLWNMFGGFVVHLRNPFEQRYDVCTRGYRAGLDSGDHLYAAYNIVNRARGRLYAGEPLGEFLAGLDQDAELVRTTLNNRPMYDLLQVYKGFALNLQGETASPDSLDHEGFSERHFRRRYSEGGTLVGHVDAFRLRCHYLSGDDESALRVIEQTDLASIDTQVEGEEFRFHASLTLLRSSRRAGPRQRERYLDLASRYHTVVRKIADSCPANFRSHDLLLSAERARLERKEIEAMNLYDQAIASARDGGLIHNEALANELAAAYSLKAERTQSARMYALEARDCYLRWGADRKARDLESRYGELLDRSALASRDGMSGRAAARPGVADRQDGTSLDMITVTKASQAISREIELGRLLSEIMTILIENAGARKGFLVLESDGELRIEAAAYAGAPKVAVGQSTLVSQSDDLSAAIVRYVARTQEDVLLHDAARQGAFIEDEYVLTNQPKSILCTSLRRKDEILGVLYLENDLAAHAFTQDRLTIIRILLTQAAISLENARLYESVKSEVAERKRAQEEQARAEEQLRQAQKMEAVGRLAGGVAHDFNNLLQGIQGYTELALAAAPPDGALRADLEEVMSASGRAAALVRQLLTFSRRETLQRRRLDLNEVVAGLMKMVRRLIGEHVELTIAPGGDIGTVHADPGQMEQLILNLCLNARDAMPEGGRIVIETGKATFDKAYLDDHPWAVAGDYVTLSVSDTGVGIPAEVRDRIFEPFFTTKEVGQGTGLGLATVYAIVKRHEGDISVHSEPGKGTTFRVCLPAEPALAEDAPPEVSVPDRSTEDQTSSALQAPAGGATILVAEDEELVRDLVVKVLEKAGYSLLVARDGREALDLFERHQSGIDLVLLDVVMPKLGGKAVFEAVRQSRPDLPAILCSGYSADVLGTDDLVDDGYELLQKPHNVKDLLDCVRRSLERRPGR